VRRLLRVDQPVQLARRSFSFTRKAVAFSSPDPRSPRSAFTWRCQPRRDSELMPSSRAKAVTVLPEKSTSEIASRLNSSVYRFVYLLQTRCYFPFNLKIPVFRCP
jgi:hypothetical protein